MATTPQTESVIWDDATVSAWRTVMGSGVREQSFKKNTFLGVLDQKKKTFLGGRELHVPVGATGTSRMAFVERYSAVNLTDQQNNTLAKYVRSRGYTPCEIADTEERDCDTPEKVYDLLKDKMKQTKMEHNNGLATSLWASSEVTNPQSLVGPRLAFPTDGGASVVYAGIPVANTWWVCQSNTTGGAAATVLPGYLDSMDYLTSAGGDDEWDLGVTHKDVHKALKQAARTYMQFTVNPTSKNGKRIADLGYSVVEWNGKPIIWDENCPSGYFYGISTNSCYLACADDAPGSQADSDAQGNGLTYEMLPWVWLHGSNMVGRGTFVTSGQQFVVEERRRNFQISGLT